LLSDADGFLTDAELLLTDVDLSHNAILFTLSNKSLYVQTCKEDKYYILDTPVTLYTAYNRSDAGRARMGKPISPVRPSRRGLSKSVWVDRIERSGSSVHKS